MQDNSEAIGLHAELGARVVVLPETLSWASSPAAGVERGMLDRLGGEDSRATSLVRYAPGATLPLHTHPVGEELLVLEGLFSDAHGQYPKGTYVRNPVGLVQAPLAGPEGVTLFVKLHQIDAQDTKRVVIETKAAGWFPGSVPGLSVLPLHEFGGEHTALVRWAPHTRFHGHRHYGGEEILVLEGVFCDEHGHYPVGSWIRSPHLSAHTPFTEAEGAMIFVKVGHLPIKK
jgi:anti-sigma factor ChrR (cupin superfamily)